MSRWLNSWLSLRQSSARTNNTTYVPPSSCQWLQRGSLAPHHGSASTMASVSGAPPPQPQSLTGPAAVEEYLAQHHAPGVSWHTALNNHVSARPRQSVRRHQLVECCKTYKQMRGGGFSCNLDLPRSFARGDGRQLHGTGAGETKEEASEKACRHAMAQLLVSDSSRVVLRPRH